MDDTQYISQLLSGVAPNGIQCGGRHGGRSSRGRGRGPPHQQHQSSAGRGPQPAADDTAGPSSSTSPLSKPSNKSTTKLFHCDICDVWVPSKSGNWDTHVAGIRHRRQLLSLRDHGERGHLVQSIFESAPTRHIGEPSNRRGLSRAFLEKVMDGTFDSPECKREYEAMRTSLLVQVLNMYGNNPSQDRTYNAAAAEFTATSIYAEEFHLQQAMETDPCLTIKLCAYPRRRRSHCEGVGCLVVAAHRLQQQTFPPDVTLETLPYRNRTTAAIWYAALYNFISALADHPAGVTELTLCIGGDGTTTSPLIHRVWHHISLALQKLLSRNYCLQHVSIILTQPSMSVSDNSSLNVQSLALAGIKEDQERFRELAAARSAETRVALLLGTHPRAGRCSILQLLPREAMRAIIELAVPRQGCEIAMTLNGSTVPI